MEINNKNKYNFKFKNKNPDYFKNYYKKNKHKYNQHSNKTQWYGIEILDKMYVFNRKLDIKIKSIGKEDLDKPNVIRIDT